MFNSSTVVVGLEIGTSKVCVAVGELSAQGVFSILGLGQCRSGGVRKGEIIDSQRTLEDVRTALAEAEQMANVEIRKVYLGVTGSHVESATSRGIHPILSDDRTITEEDLQDAVKNARMPHLGPAYVALHSIRQAYAVDSMGEVENPVDMIGSMVEARVHFIYGHVDRIRNAHRVVDSLQLEVEQPVFCGLASSLAVLDADLKKDGALVIDFGAGTTEYALYANGILRNSGVLAVGGDHVSNDLAIGLRVPLGRAESLKIEHGHVYNPAAVPRMQAGTTSAGAVGLTEKAISLESLRRIQTLRVEETLEVIARKLGPSLQLAQAGVFLCGGGARTPGIFNLTEQTLGLPVHPGVTRNAAGPTNAFEQPEFVTAIGLAIFGGMHSLRRKPRRFGGLFGNWGL
jgi:cell division protein FtsA